MAEILKVDDVEIHSYQKKSEKLKSGILEYYYSEKENKLYYLIVQSGTVDKSQEGLGISFAIIFGILKKEQALQLIQNVVVSKFGITSMYPDFARYSPSKQADIII